jgi:hypothetical protein
MPTEALLALLISILFLGPCIFENFWVNASKTLDAYSEADVLDGFTSLDCEVIRLMSNITLHPDNWPCK